MAATVDIWSRRVPNALTAGIVALGLVLAATHATQQTLTSAMAGSVVGLLLMLPGHVVGSTGAGDVKLLAAFGTLLGPERTVVAFFYTAIAGGLLALVVAVRRGTLSRTVKRV